MQFSTKELFSLEGGKRFFQCWEVLWKKCKNCNFLKHKINVLVRNRRLISPLILSEYKWIKQVLFPLKSSENIWFSDDFRGNRSQFINLNSVVIRTSANIFSEHFSKQFAAGKYKWEMSVISSSVLGWQTYPPLRYDIGRKSMSCTTLGI